MIVDALPLDQRSDRRLATDRLLGVALGAVDEVVLALAHGLEVRVRVDAAAVQRVGKLVPELVRARVDVAVRDLDRRLLGDRVDNRPAVLLLDFLLGRLGDAGGDVVLELLQRVVAEVLGGELVVQLRKGLLFDGVDVDLEDGFLAGQVLGAVLVREGHVHDRVLAGLRAVELLFEAGDELAGAELQHVVVAGAALEGLVVELAEEVDVDEVAALGGAVDVFELAEAVLHRQQARRRLAARSGSASFLPTSMPS